MSEEEEQSAAAGAYVRAVGARLRTVRHQIGLSLQAVEALSTQEFKASVLGAYERGERAISVARLQRLAKLYQVSVDQLLPSEEDATRWWVGPQPDGRPPPAPVAAAQPWESYEAFTIDLLRLKETAGPERDVLRRFVNMIQVQRQDFNGHVLTLRAGDARAIACLFGVTPDALGKRLDDLHLRVASPR
ncbi:MAG TPA: transcriptional regulator [Acidimicrobiales bacterium]|nr:transcriptional regulator [Acidimicrobiales bacterium]